MRFAFDAVDAAGRRERGEIAAVDERSALKALSARGLTAVAIAVQPDAPRKTASRRIRAADRSLAVRQLSGLIDGGVNLPDALASVAENSSAEAVSAELRSVNAALKGGDSLAIAFAKAPQLLPLVERQVVIAGAEAGDLARVLSRLADYLEERDALRGKLVGSLVYPALVGVVALGVIVALLVFVMPQIVSAFAQTKQQLPLLTRTLMLLASSLKSYGLWIGAALAFLAIAMIWLLRAQGWTWLRRVPLVGPLAQSADEVRVLTTLAMLVESAVPLPRAMTAAARTARFPDNARRLEASRELLERGSGVASAFAQTQALDGMSLELLRHGESVGGVAGAFAKAAHLKRQSLDRRLQWFATLVEPILILVLGGVVLLLVLAVMLPIVTLNSAVR